VQDLARVAVHTPAQLGNLVTRPGPDVLRDRTDPRIPNRRDEIAPLDQLPAARLSRVALDRLPTLGKLAGDIGSRQISQQRRREQLHDRQVVAELVGSQVAEQAAAAPVIDGPGALGRLHADRLGDPSDSFQTVAAEPRLPEQPYVRHAANIRLQHEPVTGTAPIADYAWRCPRVRLG
jgi:hypothetical protein